MTLAIGNGRIFWGSLSGIVVVALAITGAFLWRPPWAASEQHAAVGPQVETINPLRRSANKVTVPSEVFHALDIKTEPAKKAIKPRVMPGLAGRLALDNNTLARIPPRFPGEIVSIGTVAGGEIKMGVASDSEVASDRALRYGDRVKAGQLLAVLWSKDLGEKKSEFVDAVCRVKADTEYLERLKGNAYVIPAQQIFDAQKTLQIDEIAVRKAENTLRTWRLTDADISALTKEAENLQSQPLNKRSAFERWARVEIRAPQPGVIVEMNISLGSLINDTTTDLFKIADTKKLMVWAYVYEDDLPLLTCLFKQGPVPWTVHLPSQPQDKGSAGTLQQIGEMIDPIQHTAIVMGQVDNSKLELKAGQYVTVTIELPPDDDEVEIPTTALIENGKESVVFVQVPGTTLEFECRKVVVSRRYHDVVYLRDSLRPGEMVMTKGALLLNDAMNE